MAKNFMQDGNTIPVNNAGTAVILSGSPVVLGGLVAVAITDIPAKEVGDGFTTGVFLLPKLPADVIPVGTDVFIKDGKIQLDKATGIAAGIAWESAGAGETVIEVKING